MFGIIRSRRSSLRTAQPQQIRPRRSRPLVECLEDRSTPSITLPTAGTPGPVTITGTNGPDQFVVRLQPGTPSNIQFSDNNGASFQTAALADVASVSIAGLGGRDSLTVDNSNGLVAQAINSALQSTNLVSDQPGVAPITDPNLINAWGIAPAGGNFWVSSEGAGLALIYTGDVAGQPLAKVPLEVAIPGGSPTGQVFNGTTDFDLPGGTTPAIFIFASESGTVSAWEPTLGPAAQAVFTATDDANYKGIALGNNGTGNFLYLADFHNGKIDVLDGTFNEISLAGSFTDPSLPAGYAPFNVAVVNNQLLVSYAVQDDDGEDDIAGAGNGIINVFDLNGNFVERLVTNGALNSPWGMVVAPASFGTFAGDLLVGNFGDGRINAYDLATGEFQGQLREASGEPISIDGLWGLAFGDGTTGTAGQLYFAAGPDDETHGLFGKITLDGTATVGLPILFDGGPGLDTLSVVGDSGVPVTEDFTPTSSRSGSLALTTGVGTTAGLTIGLTNVSAVIDTTTADSLTIHVGDNNRIVDIFKGKTVNGDATIKVKGPHAAALGGNVVLDDDDDADVQDNGDESGRGMMPFSFANKTDVTIAASVASNTGQLFIVNAKQPSEGLESLTIDGGGGFDVAVQPHLPSGVTVTLESIERTHAKKDDTFVNNLYAIHLDRLPSQAELNGWNAIAQQSGEGAVVRGISQSFEARMQLVRHWYSHFLGRTAGDSEAAGWANILQSGSTEEQVMSSILGSQEFLAHAQTLFNTGNANRNMLSAAYQLILGRTASPGELDGWAAVLPGAGQAAVARGFLGSAEFRTGAIRTYYSVILNRAADSGGLTGWVNSGQSLGDVRVAFESSDEFTGEGD